MPIPRRTSNPGFAAVQTQTSGVYRAVGNIADLDDAFLDLENLPQLEEVVDEPMDVPSLAPAPVTVQHPSTQMRAVVAPAPAAFDAFDDAPSNLEIALDIKAPPSSRQAITTMAGVEIAPPTPQADADPRPGIIAFAGYGLPPDSIGKTPAYAIRVLSRKWTLRDDLRIARMRRIADVSLYEAALRCADEGAVTTGIALIVGATVATLSAVVAAASYIL